MDSLSQSIVGSICLISIFLTLLSISQVCVCYFLPLIPTRWRSTLHNIHHKTIHALSIYRPPLIKWKHLSNHRILQSQCGEDTSFETQSWSHMGIFNSINCDKAYVFFILFCQGSQRDSVSFSLFFCERKDVDE